MRLVCPNCAAQYNVDDRVIPPGGRDVQCSNCGQTWFQTGAERPRVRPAGTPAPAAPEPAAPEPPEPPMPDPDTWDAGETPEAAEPAAEPGEPAAPASAQPETAAPARALPVLEDDGDWEDDEPVDHLPPARADGIGPAPRPPAPGAETGAVQGRRVLDEAVLSILREEAEREARARRAEVQGMETQGELGLTSPLPVPGRSTVEAAPRHTAEAEGLPDAKQITSTLDARDGADELAPAPAARQGAGFRLGFSLMLLLAALALALYLLAPQISAAVPALADPLAAYAEAVNAARLWLERTVEGLAGGG